MQSTATTGEHGSDVREPAGIDENIEAYRNMLEQLEQHHNRKWVVIHDRNYIDSFDTFENAVREAARRFGRGPYLIRQVGERRPRLPTSVQMWRIDETDKHAKG